MGRVSNFLLVLLVIVCGVSLWLAQGRPWPDSLSWIEVPEVEERVEFQDVELEPVHVVIQNATDKSGLAGDVALLITRLGCVVEGVGNAAGWPGSKSVLINRRLPSDRADGLAASLGGIPVIKEWDGRTTEDAVLVLGQDFENIRTVLRAVRH